MSERTAAAIVAGLETDGYVIIDRPALTGRTLAMQAEGRTSTMAQAERATRDVTECERTEQERRDADLYTVKRRAGYGPDDTPAEPRRTAYTDDTAGDVAYRRAVERWETYLSLST